MSRATSNTVCTCNCDKPGCRTLWARQAIAEFGSLHQATCLTRPEHGVPASNKIPQHSRCEKTQDKQANSWTHKHLSAVPQQHPAQTHLWTSSQPLGAVKYHHEHSRVRHFALRKDILWWDKTEQCSIGRQGVLLHPRLFGLCALFSFIFATHWEVVLVEAGAPTSPENLENLRPLAVPYPLEFSVPSKYPNIHLEKDLKQYVPKPLKRRGQVRN